jgi:hypothetical protein
LALHEPEGWGRIWERVGEDAEAAEGVLLEVGVGPKSEYFVDRLGEAEAADIYIFLGGRCSGNKEEGESGRLGLGSNRRRVLEQQLSVLAQMLAARGTPAACAALRRMIKALPEHQGLILLLRTAEEQMREKTWTPPEPVDVLRLVRRAESRLVRSGPELLGVLEESIERLEKRLQGITPMAEALWNEVTTTDESPRRFRPKLEPWLSDFVKDHLELDLAQRGIILNREVEFRRGTGGAPGERTEARIGVVIEVKGCWNRKERWTAMKKQLVDRYMKDKRFVEGLYLLGWYECSQWDHKDDKWKKRPKCSIEEASGKLEAQARELSDGRRTVRAVVLNAALR